jgi:hypothetical protein
LAYAHSTSATQEFSLRLEGNISNDFNQSMVSASVALFRTTGTVTWEKYRVDAGFGSTGVGSIATNTQFTRNSVGSLNSDNLFALGQTGGDLPDDPTFTWVGTTNSWTTTANWSISGSADPYPNSTAHFVNIGAGGTASPTLPVATTNVATISQNQKTLTVPGGATLNVGGQYVLNFPTGLLVGGTGTLTTSGVTATGTASSFDTQLLPGSYIYRASDNLFMGIVRTVTSATSFTFMNMGHFVTSLENFTVPTAFNFINPAPTPIVGTVSVDIAINDRALSISGGTFSPAMKGRAIIDIGTGALIGVIQEVVDASNAILAAQATVTYSGVAANILDGIPTSGSGSLVCDDLSTVIYGSNISQMFAPASYYNVSFVDGRSLALPAAHIYRVSFATNQTITIRGKMEGRYWVMHSPVTGLTYQFLNGSSMDITVPNFNGGLGVTAGQLWRAYNAFNPSGNVRFGAVASDRINAKFTYNRNADLTFQGPEFSIFSNGRCGNFEYIRNSNNSFIINSGNTFIVNGNTIFTNNGIGGDIMRFGNAGYTPGNQCNISFHGSFTYNGTNTTQPVFAQFNGSLHNYTFTGPGAITFPTNNGNIFIGNATGGPLTLNGTTPGFLNLTYNKPGVTLTLPAVANKHLVCLGTLTVSGGSIVAPGSPNNGDISGNAMVINGNGNITSNGSNFVGAGAGGISVSGNGSVTIVGDGNFRTFGSPGDVNISGNAVVNLSASTNLIGHSSSQDWIQTGGTVTLPDASTSPFSVARNLNISGGTISKLAGNINLSPTFAGGNFIYDGGTINAAGANLFISGTTNNQTFGSTTGKTLTVNNVTVNKAAGNFDVVSGKIRVLNLMTVTGPAIVTAQPGNITLASSATSTASIAALPSAGSVAGNNWTMERYVGGVGSAAGWYLAGTPIKGQTLGDWSDDTFIFTLTGPCGLGLIGNTGTSNVFSHDGTISPIGTYPEVEQFGWRLSDCNLPHGVGKRIWLGNQFFDSSPRLLDNTGEMNAGPFNFSVPYNLTGYTSTGGAGWNFVSNPYPSTINWLNPGWTKTNMDGAFYPWNGTLGVYGSYSAAGVASDPLWVSGDIASSQAFFVRANSAGAVLSATEAVKTATNKTFFRTANFNNLLRFKVTSLSNQKYDCGVIMFHPEATEGYDEQFDASKFSNSFINLSSRSNDIDLSINTFADLNEDRVIPLTLKVNQPGQYQFSFTGLESFDAGTQMYLRDNYLGEVTPITEGSVQNIEINGDASSQGADRFEIIFSPEAVTATKKAIPSFATSVVPNPSNGNKLTLLLQNAGSNQTKVMITDMLGKVLMNQDFVASGNAISLEPNLAAGVYQVLISNAGKTSVQKIVVNK